MRVVSGTARGVVLKTPDGMQTRPTSDKVKESIFNIIQFDLPGTAVLDLFGGTGQLGIEALSRGAKTAVFVDAWDKACALIKENIRRTKFDAKSKVVRSDYLAPAIRITLVGFNDIKSRTEFVNIISALRAKGLIVEFNQNLEFIIAVPNVCAMKVFYDFGVNVSNVGRASDNSLGKYVPDGRPNAIDGHCLQIDNNDTAILNYKHRAHINGRPMNDVLKELLAKVR